VGGGCAAELYSGKGDPGSLKNLNAKYHYLAFSYNQILSNWNAPNKRPYSGLLLPSEPTQMLVDPPPPSPSEGQKQILTFRPNRDGSGS
jgi:hypothetical protein